MDHWQQRSKCRWNGFLRWFWRRKINWS
jgi:hypothetical protein